MGIRRIYITGILIFGALMLCSFVILQHNTFPELVLNLIDFTGAKAYHPQLLLRVGILLLTPSPLLMLL